MIKIDKKMPKHRFAFPRSLKSWGFIVIGISGLYSGLTQDFKIGGFIMAIGGILIVVGELFI